MRLKTVIPKAVAGWINSEAKSKNEAERLRRLTAYITRKYVSEGIPFDQAIEISSEHFRNQVNDRYLRDLRRLIGAGIVTTDGKYYFHSPKQGRPKGSPLGRCKSYSFSPDAVFCDPTIVEYTEREKKRFSSDYVVRETVNILSKLRLTIRADQVERYVKELVTFDYIRERCKIGDEIPEGFYYTNWSERPLNRDHWQEIAQKNGKEFFIYRDKGHIGEMKRFIWSRVYQTRTRYFHALTRLKEIRKRPNISCARNTTNYRLDTNLTNIKSELLSTVRLDGEKLVSIDLSNSQFTILAHLIKWSFQYIEYLNGKYFDKNSSSHIIENQYLTTFFRNRELIQVTPNRGNIENKVINRYLEIITLINVTHFCEDNQPKPLYIKAFNAFLNLTKSGQFYEFLVSRLAADENKNLSRAEVKRIMFITVFSSHRYNPKEKQQLYKYLPEFVEWTNEFKKGSIQYLAAEGLNKQSAIDQGNASLAVMLQTIESSIFIDNILTKLLKKGYRVLSKHDSILCKESELAGVHSVIEYELDQVFGVGGYRLKIEPT